MKKILVIRYKKSLGDSLVSSALCSTLTNKFKGAKVDYLVYENILPLFKNHPCINETYAFNRSNKPIVEFLRLLKKIRHKKYDAIIDCRSIPFTGILSLFSGAKIRSGKSSKYSKLFFTHSEDIYTGTMNNIDKFSILLSSLGVSKGDYNYKYNLGLTIEEVNKFKGIMVGKGIDLNRPIIPFAITSRQNNKKWKEEYIIKVIEYCINSYQAQVIFYYSPSEKNYAKELHSKLNNNSNIFSSIETTSLRDLACIFKNCDLFIGNEGGPRHLAESVGLPTFSIYSPASSKKEWLPNEGYHHRALDIDDVKGKDHYDIKPAHVIEGINHMILDLNIKKDFLKV